MFIDGISLNEIATALGVIALLVGTVMFIFVYLKLHPNMELKITTRSCASNNDIVLVEFEVKNISQVRCRRKQISVQFLSFDDNNREYSEWVPFTQRDIISNEIPIEWKEPIAIMQTTQFWNPGDLTRIERSFKCGSSQIHKIGLQVEVSIPWIPRCVNFIQGRRLHRERWTTTKLVCSNAYQKKS